MTQLSTYFVYRTTHVPSGRVYVGKHFGPTSDYYLGSNRTLIQDFRREGPFAFKREILSTHSSNREACQEETEQIKKIVRSGVLTYNRQAGGASHIDYLRFTNGVRSVKVRKEVMAPEGWWEGTTHRHPLSFKKGAVKYRDIDRIPITDGKCLKNIEPEDKIPDGWVYAPSDVRRALGLKLGISEVEACSPHLRSESQVWTGTRIIKYPRNIPLPLGWEACESIWISNGEVQRLYPSSHTIPEGWYAGMSLKELERRSKPRGPYKKATVKLLE